MDNRIAIAEALNKQFTSESGLQRIVAKLLTGMGFRFWCHVPNEGKRNPRFGARLKQEGLKKGVPDILIFDEMIAIELKYGRNKLTEEQECWLAGLEELGWKTAVCRNVQEVIEVLDAE